MGGGRSDPAGLELGGQRLYLGGQGILRGKLQSADRLGGLLGRGRPLAGQHQIAARRPGKKQRAGKAFGHFPAQPPRPTALWPNVQQRRGQFPVGGARRIQIDQQRRVCIRWGHLQQTPQGGAVQVDFAPVCQTPQEAWVSGDNPPMIEDRKRVAPRAVREPAAGSAVKLQTERLPKPGQRRRFGVFSQFDSHNALFGPPSQVGRGPRQTGNRPQLKAQAPQD